MATFQSYNSTRGASHVYYNVTHRAVVPDTVKGIRHILEQWSDDTGASGSTNFCHLIVTTGGTGFTARDVTPEATRAVIQKEAPGLVIAMLHAVLPSVPTAMLSRAVCGIRNRTLIVNLPGSPKAVVEYLAVLFPHVAHGVKLIQNVDDTH